MIPIAQFSKFIFVLVFGILAASMISNGLDQLGLYNLPAPVLIVGGLAISVFLSWKFKVV